MVTRRFAPWRLYTSAELYESTAFSKRQTKERSDLVLKETKNHSKYYQRPLSTFFQSVEEKLNKNILSAKYCAQHFLKPFAFGEIGMTFSQNQILVLKPTHYRRLYPLPHTCVLSRTSSIHKTPGFSRFLSDIYIEKQAVQLAISVCK